MDYETTLKDDFFTQPANVCGMPLICILEKPFGIID